MRTTKSDLPNNVDAFVPDKDVTEKLDDGREVQVAVKGVPMPRAEAVRLGLTDPVTASEGVIADAVAGPTSAELHNQKIAEKRSAETADENKMSAGAAENKSASKKK